MNSTMIELLILAAIAIFVLAHFFSVLGRKEHSDNNMLTASKSSAPGEKPALRIAYTGPAAAGLEAINEKDRDFSPESFLQGARKAYKMIVNSFANSDKSKLQTLLTDDVYQDYSDAIDARDEDQDIPALSRIKSAEIVEAELDGNTAKISVSFEAELSQGERYRPTQEIWTFQRSIRDSDPNWRLSDVVTAS